MIILRDWQNRQYQVEVVFTRLDTGFKGYIVHVDDEPFREGEMFRSRVIAMQAVKAHLDGLGQ